MTIEEIQEEKPDGATHIDNQGDYWKVVGDIELYFHMGCWIEYIFTLDRAKEKYELKPL